VGCESFDRCDGCTGPTNDRQRINAHLKTFNARLGYGAPSTDALDMALARMRNDMRSRRGATRRRALADHVDRRSCGEPPAGTRFFDN